MRHCDRIVFMLTIVSVVRDFEMHKKCIGGNNFCKNAKIIALDNRRNNKPIPALYNHFIDALAPGTQQWIIFCHEDFQFLEDFSGKINALDKNFIWGPIGVRLTYESSLIPGGVPNLTLCGTIYESKKDGRHRHRVGAGGNDDIHTLDCQCIIVHSSLLQKTGLRFDEALTFDLYAEDFCAQAHERHGIKTKIFPILCQHWSGGTLTERYFRQLEYLNGKYPRSEYPSTVGYSFGRGPCLARRIQRYIMSIIRPYRIKQPPNSPSHISADGSRCSDRKPR